MLGFTLPIINYDYNSVLSLVNSILDKFVFSYIDDISLYLSLISDYRKVLVSTYVDFDVNKLFISDFSSKLYIPHFCNIRGFKKVINCNNSDLCFNLGTDNYLLEPKVDGVMVSLYFYNRRLLLAITRGDKYGGEKVTTIIGSIVGVHLSDYQFDNSFTYSELFNQLLFGLVEIKGELYLDIDDFNKYLFNKYVSPRCAVVGLINNINFDLTSPYYKLLRFVAYDFGILNKLMFCFSQDCTYRLINLLGISTVDYVYCDSSSLFASYNKLLSSSITIPIDGVVVKSNLFMTQFIDIFSFKRLFSYLFAIKKVDISYTYIRDISCSVGKNGVIVFTAIIDFVNINNVFCNKINLYSYHFILSNSIGIGDYIEVVYNAIFVFKKVITSCNNQFYLNLCPCCGSKLVESGLNLFCINYGCCGRVSSLLSNFFRKSGVVGISKKTVMLLIRNGLICGAISIFDLVNCYSQLVSVKGIGKLKAAYIVSEIKKLSLNISCSYIVMLLGIHGIGDRGAVLLAPYLGGLSSDDFTSIINSIAFLNVLQRKSLLLFLSDESNRRLLCKLLLLLKNVKEVR